MRIGWMRIQFVSKLNQVWKGLKNAPAVFQWLVEKFLQQLNLVDGKEFVSVYIDDILVFSFFFQEHMWSMCHKSSKLCRMLDGNWNLLSVDWSGISWLSSNSWWSALQCFPEKKLFPNFPLHLFSWTWTIHWSGIVLLQIHRWVCITCSTSAPSNVERS